MKKINILLLVIVILFSACKDNSSTKNDNNSNDKESTIIGYKYKKLKNGDGILPKNGDIVSFDVDIVSPTGEMLQSHTSFRERPSLKIDRNKKEPKPNPVLSLLEISSVGDSISLIMPKDSMGKVPPAMKDMDYIQYVIVVRKIKNMAEMKAREKEVAEFVKTTLAEYKSGKSKVEDYGNGIKSIIHEVGKGELPQAGKPVKVNYYGVLFDDGSTFDNSFKRGKEFTFPLGLGRVIKGWDEGVAKLKKGSKATLIIPGDMGYGIAGSPPNIPEDATLVFYIEVLE